VGDNKGDICGCRLIAYHVTRQTDHCCSSISALSRSVAGKHIARKVASGHTERPESAHIAIKIGRLTRSTRRARGRDGYVGQ
jgi:hypothetical protein